jgi:hypothetical protein
MCQFLQTVALNKCESKPNICISNHQFSKQFYVVGRMNNCLYIQLKLIRDNFLNKKTIPLL